MEKADTSGLGRGHGHGHGLVPLRSSIIQHTIAARACNFSCVRSRESIHAGEILKGGGYKVARLTSFEHARYVNARAPGVGFFLTITKSEIAQLTSHVHV